MRPEAELIQAGPKAVAGADTATLMLSVVIPVFNERSTIEEVIQRVLAVPLKKEIIVVDDGSTDGTRELLQEIAVSGVFSNAADSLSNNVRFLFQESNRGKGAALRRGFTEAAGDIIIVQDADLELDPADYPRLIAPIVCGRAEVVYGSRFLRAAKTGMPFRYRVANKVLTFTSNLLTGLDLTDVWIGYKVFRRELLNGISLQEERFGFEPEFTAKIARSGRRVAEVPVSYANRSVDQGKKIRLKDGIKGMWSTIRYSLFG